MIKIKKSEYVKDIMTLMSGTMIAQVLTLLIIPIITRLYSPEEFGQYSVVLAVATTFGLIACLKYEQAIILTKNLSETKAGIHLCLLILLTFFLISLIFAFFLKDELGRLLNLEGILIYSIPLIFLLVGLNNILTSLCIKLKDFKLISIGRVFNALSIGVVQVGAKKLFSLNGLLVGKVFSESINFSILIRKVCSFFFVKDLAISKTRLIYFAKKHYKFPRYQALTVFINSMSQNLPILLLGALYGPFAAGNYALVTKVLQVPIALVGSATRDVFYQKAANLNNNGKSFYDLYVSTTTYLIKIFLPILLLAILFGEQVFVFVFGEPWRQAAELIGVLIFWAAFAFVNPPSVATFSVLNLQSKQLLIEVFSVLLRILAIYLGFYFHSSYYSSIFYFSIVSALSNLVLILYIYYKLFDYRR